MKVRTIVHTALAICTSVVYGVVSAAPLRAELPSSDREARQCANAQCFGATYCRYGSGRMCMMEGPLDCSNEECGLG